MRPLNFFSTPDPTHASVPRSSANVWGGIHDLVIVAACIGSRTPSTSSGPAPGVHDPGVRGGPAGAGGALPASRRTRRRFSRTASRGSLRWIDAQCETEIGKGCIPPYLADGVPHTKGEGRIIRDDRDFERVPPPGASGRICSS